VLKRPKREAGHSFPSNIWTERKLSSKTFSAQMIWIFWHVRSLQCMVQLQGCMSPCGSVS